jgi:pantoate--beta-alanine ligase
MKIITSKVEMQNHVNNIKNTNLKIGFTPTLGCLHNGHISLLKESKKYNNISICSIFINPLQFKKDKFIKYPNNIEKDIKILQKNDVDIVFLPTTKEVFENTNFEELYSWQEEYNYKQTKLFDIEIKNNFPFIRVSKELSNKMSGGLYPWHFDGVASIVYFLFNIIKPENSYFGKKDPQQVFIIEKMKNYFNIPVKINKVDIIREKDGTPFSSRNSVLNKNQRLLLSEISSIFRKHFNKINFNSYTKMILDNTKNDILNLKKNEGNIFIENIDIIDQNNFNSLDICNTKIIFYINYSIDDIRLTDCYYKNLK